MEKVTLQTDLKKDIYTRIKHKIKIELDLPNCLRGAIHQIRYRQTNKCGLNSLKVENIDVDKLKVVPIDLEKLRDEVDENVLKKYNGHKQGLDKK